VIQVTLMTQNITTIRASPSDAAATLQSDVTDNYETSDEAGKTSGLKRSEQSGVEVVCGPVELAKYVDLSGTQGIVPLTSMKLMKVKSKSFLLRFKAKSSRGEKSSAAVDKPTQVCVFICVCLLAAVVSFRPLTQLLLLIYSLCCQESDPVSWLCCHTLLSL